MSETNQSVHNAAEHRTDKSTILAEMARKQLPAVDIRGQHKQVSNALIKPRS